MGKSKTKTIYSKRGEQSPTWEQATFGFWLPQLIQLPSDSGIGALPNLFVQVRIRETLNDSGDIVRRTT
jgi:hypothetical protein